MKRVLIVILILALCLCGCKKKQTDISGLEETPEGVDWRVWDTYVSGTLTMGGESFEVLMGLDAIHLVIYYDQEEQKEMAKLTILEPLSDLEYSRNHLQIGDQNQDGYDDICIPDMLPSGDRVMNWWLWDAQEGRYDYSEEESESQEEIGGDITWMEGRHFIPGSMDTPLGPQELQILVEETQILVYLNEREEILWGTAQLPQPLSQEVKDYLLFYSYWDCWDVNGDEYGDLQVPYRWEEDADGALCQYNYCWTWDPENNTYVFDAETSGQPVIW